MILKACLFSLILTQFSSWNEIIEFPEEVWACYCVLNGNPDMWGVVIHEENEILYFTGIDKVRFRKPVVPGDQLILEAEITNLRSKVSKMAGRALVGGDLAAEGILMAAIGE